MHNVYNDYVIVYRNKLSISDINNKKLSFILNFIQKKQTLVMTL